VAGSVLRDHPSGFDPAVGVAGAAIFDPQPVDHGVTLQRVRVAPERGEPRIGAVAEVRPGEVGRKAALHKKVIGFDLATNGFEASR
jgi:hypothetical protein